jgi:chromate transporter
MLAELGRICNRIWATGSQIDDAIRVRKLYTPEMCDSGVVLRRFARRLTEREVPVKRESHTDIRCSTLTLCQIFLRIGAVAFGGIGTALALIDRELVSKRQWLTAADVTEALTYTKLLPGSTVVQVVSYVGYKLGGWSGSAVATAAFVLPSALLMLVLSAAYVAATGIPAFYPAVNGLTAVVVGILLATTYRLGKANIKEYFTLAIALVAVVAGAVFDIHAALITTVGGLLGVSVLPILHSRQELQEVKR